MEATSTLLVVPNWDGGYPVEMPTVQDVRRQNLVALIAKEGGPVRGRIVRFAEATGSDPTHISQILKGRREMGSEVARRIEDRKHLGVGAMDRPLTAQEAPGSPSAWDEEFMRWLIVRLETDLREAARELSPEEKAEVILRTYGIYAGTGERPVKAVLLRLVRRA